MGNKFDSAPYTQLTSPARGDIQGVIKDVSEALPENQTKFAALEDLLKYGAWASTVRTVTASAAVTLVDTDPYYVEIDPNGANRDVTCPAKSDDNHGYVIRHTGAGYTLTVKRSGGATITTVAVGEIKYIIPSTINDFIVLTIGGSITVQALTDGATINWNAALGSVGTVTFGGSRTFAAPTNLVAGQTYQLILTQDGTGGRHPTWNAVFKNMPQINENASAVTVLDFISDGTNLYYLPFDPTNITQALTDGATVNWNAALGRWASVTFAGSRTMAAPTNLVAGRKYYLICTQDGTGGRNPTWNAVFKNVPQIYLTASAVTLLEFISDGTNLYYSGGMPSMDPPTETGTSGAAPTVTAAINGLVYTLTGLATAPTFGVPGGSPKDGYRMLWRIKDNGTARALAYNAIFRAMGVALPTTTVISKYLILLWVYNATDTKWDLLAANTEA